MFENKRFEYSDVWGWNIDSFLNVMNGLDRKNNKLKDRIKELEKENKKYKQYYEESRRKEEITNIIWETMMENIKTIEYRGDGKEHPVEAIYNKLKEKDVIK